LILINFVRYDFKEVFFIFDDELIVFDVIRWLIIVKLDIRMF